MNSSEMQTKLESDGWLLTESVDVDNDGEVERFVVRAAKGSGSTVRSGSGATADEALADLFNKM